MDPNLNFSASLTLSQSPLRTFSMFNSSIGLLANLIALYIIVANTFFRKNIYYFLLICCMMNSMLSVGTLSFTIVISNKNLSLSTITTWCRILFSLIYTSYGVTILNFSLIAIHRYFAVVKPFSNFYLTYKNRFLITSEIIICIISFAASMPTSFYIGVEAKSKDYCDYPNITISVAIYLICFVVIYYIVPSSIIITLYWRIIVHQRNRVRPGLPSIHDRIDIRKKYQLIRSLICISACYILLTWPIFTVLFAMAITQTSLTEIRQENSIYFWLGLISISTCKNIAVINPFLYFIFDQNIRHRLRYRLKKLLKR